MKLALFAVLLAAQSFGAAVIHNGDVIRMVRKGIPVAEIVGRINAARSGFVLYPEDVASLKEDGVPEIVIRAMSARQTGEKLIISGNGMPLKAATDPASNANVAPTESQNVSRAYENSGYGIAHGAVAASGAALSRTGMDYLPFGLQLGSVAADGSGGFAYYSGLSGVHPTFGGSVTVGLNKYIGIFGQGGYGFASSRAYCVGGYVCGSTAAHLTYIAGGLEFVATNRSRIVPYGRVGGGYGRAAASITIDPINLAASMGAGAITFGGGVRTYVTRHLGMSAGVQALRFVGPYGGGTAFLPLFGVFVQSR